LNVNGQPEEIVTLELVDVTGKTLLEKDFMLQSAYDQINVDITPLQLKTGVYLIKANRGGAQRKVIRMLKQE
jgi:hypothetical protein